MTHDADGAARTVGLRWLDHTADVGFDVSAPDLPELFVRALRGVVAAMMDAPPERPEGVRGVHLRASSIEGLLVRWLDETIYATQTLGRVPVRAQPDIRRDGDGWMLEAKVHDAPLDPAAHRWRSEVKAATFHGLDVHEEAGAWRARVVLDV